jgi:hypothetical protein
MFDKMFDQLWTFLCCIAVACKVLQPRLSLPWSRYTQYTQDPNSSLVYISCIYSFQPQH